MIKAISRSNFVSSLYFCMHFVRRFVRVKSFIYNDLTTQIQKIQKYPITSLRERDEKEMSIKWLYYICSYIYIVENFCIFCISTLNPFNYNNLPHTKNLTNPYKNTKLLK